MELSKLKEILDLAKRYGATCIKVDGCEVQLPQTVTVADFDPKHLIDPFDNPAMEDEVKFFSAGGSGLKNADGTDFVMPLMGEERGQDR